MHVMHEPVQQCESGVLVCFAPGNQGKPSCSCAHKEAQLHTCSIHTSNATTHSDPPAAEGLRSGNRAHSMCTFPSIKDAPAHNVDAAHNSARTTPAPGASSSAALLLLPNKHTHLFSAPMAAPCPRRPCDQLTRHNCDVCMTASKQRGACSHVGAQQHLPPLCPPLSHTYYAKHCRCKADTAASEPQYSQPHHPHTTSVR